MLSILGLAGLAFAVTGGAYAAPPAVSTQDRYPNAKPSRVYVPLKRATAWEIRNRAQKAALYANTPQHPPTRQQRRYAAQKGHALA